MILERTISQLDIGYVPEDQAEDMGHMGYLQWLGSLRGDAGYPTEAMRAYEMARPFIRTSPAIAVFCRLLIATTATPLTPIELRLPSPTRRGGSKARRGAV